MLIYAYIYIYAFIYTHTQKLRSALEMERYKIEDSIYFHYHLNQYFPLLKRRFNLKFYLPWSIYMHIIFIVIYWIGVFI